MPYAKHCSDVNQRCTDSIGRWKSQSCLHRFMLGFIVSLRCVPLSNCVKGTLLFDTFLTQLHGAVRCPVVQRWR